mgnify:CR=1 FL=1
MYNVLYIYVMSLANLEAELCACMEGLSLSLPVMIHMDSLVAVKLIQAKEVDRSIYALLIKEIRYFMSLR